MLGPLILPRSVFHSKNTALIDWPSKCTYCTGQICMVKIFNSYKPLYLLSNVSAFFFGIFKVYAPYKYILRQRVNMAGQAL